MNNIYIVHLSKQALKDVKKVPSHVAWKLQAWIDDLGHCGLNEVRKIIGYHDEPLKGTRQGQYSIRLNKGYRAIYVVDKNENVRFVEIIEVTKHAY